MSPDLSNMNKVLNRIEEIAQRCSQPFEFRRAPLGTPPASRFVDVLDKLDKPGAGKAGAYTAMDDLRKHVSRSAEKYNIDEELVRAVIQVESGWRADAVSSKGARGLMQLMPGTAKMLGVEDAFDPEQNIEGGVKYLAQLTDKYNGDVEMALAAYNAGPSRVKAASGIPFAETARYVKNVMALYHRYREEE
ncbi:MAG: lytic transglycosylase domain-containing protein [Synergistaceae bacterium]|jgi:soluble lytic murein transglycosylase-like protein|nr:lytic transglycosylase domain-containing protein [Synergistaceae bacterium]